MSSDPARSGRTIDIAANRRARKWSHRELVARAAWEILQPLFRFSPRPMWGWRAGMLRLFGASIGRHVHLHPTVVVTIPWNLRVHDYVAVGEAVRIYNLGPVEIGESVTVSQGAHLCAGTHDYTRVELPLVKSSIKIAAQAWVCADAFVGPAITIGEGAIVAARAVAVRDVAPWTIVAGNPAKPVRRREPPSIR
jgi:putative colanic acid biosynthesis acetyltransferase WcaF